MIAALAVFIFVVGAIMGSYYGLMQLPGWMAARKLDRRLREVTLGTDPVAGQKKSLITEQKVGPLPASTRHLAVPTRRWRSSSSSRALRPRRAPSCSAACWRDS
jgi:hypothetical protein